MTKRDILGVNKEDYVITTDDIRDDQILSNKLRDYLKDYDYDNPKQPIVTILSDFPHNDAKYGNVSQKVCQIIMDLYERGEIDQKPMMCRFTNLLENGI